MKKITFWLFALFTCLQINAQVSSYSFLAGTGGVLDPMTGSTQLVASASDDGVSAVTNIGFTFNYAGIDYTQFSVNANGLVRLGATVVTTQWTNTTANVALTLPAIMPYWDDLATGSAAGGGKVHYVVTGTAPNRKLIIEWFVTIPRATTGAANAKFQCVLNETTNVLEFVYGAGMLVNTPTTGATIGLATSATIFNTVDVTTNTNSNAVFKLDNTAAIASGTIYTFTPPTCPGSTAMTATSITNSSATVNWVAPTPTAPSAGYEYAISTVATAPTGSGTATTGTTASFTGLLSNTTYYVYVRSNCGSEFGSWIAVGTFKTLCDSVTEFIETFDTSTTGVGFLPNCWSKAGTSANVYNTTGSVAPMSPANRLYMNISTTTNAFAVLPPVSNLQAETHRLKLKAYATAASKKLQIGYFTDPSDVATFVFFEEIDLPSTAATTALEFTIVPTAIPVGVTNLVLSTPTGVATTIYIDDVKWEFNSSCVEPTVLSVSGLTNNTATLAWTNGGPETEWEIQYGLTGFTFGTGTIVSGVTTNPYVLSGLTADTSYQYYIRGLCTGAIYSSWSGPFAFRTNCNSVTEFIENFDTAPTGTGNLPSCWSNNGTTGNVYNTTGSVAPMSPANRLYMNISATTSAFASLPPVSNLQAETHRLKFKAYATSTLKKLRVGYFTNPGDAGSYVFFEEIDLPSTAATTATEFTIVPYSIPVGVSRLVLSVTPGVAATVYVDDVKWEENSSCIEPTALNASLITNSSAQLSWVNGGAEPAWEVQYGITGFTLGTGTIITGVATNPYVLSSLTPNTTYQYYVRGVCAGPTNSSWSGPFTFKTLCDDVTEFSENFDSYPASTTSLPNCWSRGGSSTSTYITTGAAAPMSPANRLYMFASGTTPTEGYAIMPPVSNLAANTHRLKFKAYATINPRNLIVGYLTDPSDVSTFVELQTVSVPGTALANTQNFVVTPGALPAGVKCLAFKNPGFTASSATFYIDDVVWEPIPSNPPVCVTNLTATPDAACGNFPTTLSWTASPDTDGHYLTIGTTPGGSDVLNNSNIGIVTSYSFSGNFNTTYYYTLVPFNAVGSATGCVEQSFTTFVTGCVCTPVYTTGVTSNDYFSNLVLQGTTLSNNSGTTNTTGTPSYHYYTGQPNYTATLTEGTAYTFETTIGFSNQAFSVWIDLDDNLTFSESERIGGTITNITGTAPVTGTFQIAIPCGANPGLHRMRVRMVYAAVGSTMDPCASATFGEAEDYDVTIAPIAAPTGAAAQTICNSGTIADLVVVGTSIKWYDVATAGTELPSTTALVSGTTYYASQTVGTCEGLSRLAVTATVTPDVTPAFDPIAAICSGSTAPTLPLTSTNGITGTWSPATVDNMATATYTFTPDAGQCVTSTTVTLDVTVNALPATPTGDAAQTFCPADGDVLADLTVTGTNLVWYDAATGGNVLPNTTTITATTYYVASNDGTCDSQRLAITTTEDCPIAPCLTAVNGQWPSATFVPNSANCDGYTLQNITTCGYASEYSVVTVVSGQTYTFGSYTAGALNSDVITISTDAGLTAAATGIGSVTWVATVSGDIRFYTHLDGCAAQSVCRTKTVTCGVITTDSPDYVSLQWPPTITIPQGGNGTVYGQIYEGGLTDIVPNIDGQASGITAWVGISPVGSNTNPNTWTNWTPATWNSGHISNNDEYQATIGATLLPGTYYYATRFRLNSGAYVYGGIDSSNNGNFWNGTTYNSGVLTVTPPPAPANDDCAGAYSVTVNTDLTCTSVTAGTLVGATASTTDATACGGTEDDDVWFSFVATATTHQISLNNITGSTTDLYHSLWTGADCASLTLVPGTCSDPNTSTPTGLTIGTTYYIRVYSWTATAGQTSAFNVCVGTLPPPPANDECATAVVLTPGGTFATNPVVGTNSSATNSNPPSPGCASFAGGDVWYTVTVPASGNVTIETNPDGTSAITDTGLAVYSGSCSGLTFVECDDDDSASGNFSLISLTGRTPGEVLYVNVWEYAGGTVGTFQVSAYDASLGNGSFDSSNFTFYPNPVKDVLNLSYSQNINKVQVINILGQEVKNLSMEATQAQVDMSDLPTGTYLVKVTSDNQVKTIKVIKQ